MSSLELFTQAQRAALHRETYTAILKGMLTWGSAKAFAAETLGITPVYLSNLLDADHPPPSPELAVRIVMALPLDQDGQLNLLEHMLLAREAETAMRHSLHSSRKSHSADELFVELFRAYDSTLLTRALPTAPMSLRAVHDAGMSILRMIDPAAQPLLFVEACMIVHNIQCTLNRWDNALYLVNLSYAILSQPDIERRLKRDIRAGQLMVNVLYAAAITLRNLNLPRQALDSLAEAAELLRHLPVDIQNTWLPPLYRAQLQNISQLPRFALSEIEGLAEQANALHAIRGERQGVFELMGARAQMDAYVRYGSSRSLRQAARLADEWVWQLGDIPDLRQLERVMFLRSAVGCYWRLGKLDAAGQYVQELMLSAAEYGLEHQLAQTKRDFEPLLRLLDW